MELPDIKILIISRIKQLCNEIPNDETLSARIEELMFIDFLIRNNCMYGEYSKTNPKGH